MPTVLRIDGFRVVIYPNDHRPAHVHIMTKAGEAMFILHCPDGPPNLRESFGFKHAELVRAEHLVTNALAKLCEDWRLFHDNF